MYISIKQMKHTHKFIHIKFIYAGLLAIVAMFVVSRFYPILHKVSIKTESVTDGETTNKGIIKIFGSAKKATNLYINGKSTSVTKDGEFEDAIALPAGYNIVTITAIDKFGKTSSETLRLNVGEDTIDTAMNNINNLNN